VFFGVSGPFFKGRFGKGGCLAWCFCGVAVVNCVVDGGSRMVVCAGPNIFHFFEIFLWKFCGRQAVA
jgi:hypothetical protein